MKIIVKNSTNEYVELKHIDRKESVFFGKNGDLIGAVTFERGQYWLHTSTTNILGGGFVTLEGAIEYGMACGYTFYQSVEV